MPLVIALTALLQLCPVIPATDPRVSELAEIIAGEAPTCPLLAKVAVAQVYHNRIDAGIQGGWFGRQTPRPIDIAIATHWRYWPDLVDGALYAVSREDVSRMPWLRKLVLAWDCPGNLSLQIWQ
jgi:hypothetical protein